MLVVHVDHDGLVRFLAAIRSVLEEDARAADRQFEAFAAHGLDEHAQLELAAPGNFEGVLLGAFGQADRDIAFGLPLEPLADHAALHLVAFAAGIGAVIDRETHGQRRRVDRLRGNRRADIRIAQCVGDGRFGQPGNGHDVACLGVEHRHTVEPLIGEDLGRASGLDLVAGDVERLDRHADFEPAALDPAGQDTAEEGIAVEQRRQHGESAVLVEIGCGHMADDQLEQRNEISLPGFRIFAGEAGPARGIKDREVELFVIRLERDEQIEHFVEHFGGAGIGPVDLVDDDDRLQPQPQRLAGDELGLRHRAFGGIDQQDDPVDHG